MWSRELTSSFYPVICDTIYPASSFRTPHRPSPRPFPTPRMKIKKLPNVLALHLKRFKYQEDVGKYIKLTYRVAFPFELRLFNTVDDAQNPDRLYELFAIVVHIGK